MLVSGALVSSTGAAPQTLLTPLTAKVYCWLEPNPEFWTPVTLKGADSPMFVAAAAPPALCKMSGLDCWSDCECLVTPIEAC